VRKPAERRSSCPSDLTRAARARVRPNGQISAFVGSGGLPKDCTLISCEMDVRVGRASGGAECSCPDGQAWSPKNGPSIARSWPGGWSSTSQRNGNGHRRSETLVTVTLDDPATAGTVSRAPIPLGEESVAAIAGAGRRHERIPISSQRRRTPLAVRVTCRSQGRPPATMLCGARSQRGHAGHSSALVRGARDPRRAIGTQSFGGTPMRRDTISESPRGPSRSLPPRR